MKGSQNQSPGPEVVVAAVMILIGAMLLLDKLNVLHLYQVARFWPLAVIGGGMALLLERYDSLPVSEQKGEDRVSRRS